MIGAIETGVMMMYNMLAKLMLITDDVSVQILQRNPWHRHSVQGPEDPVRRVPVRSFEQGDSCCTTFAGWTL